MYKSAIIMTRLCYLCMSTLCCANVVVCWRVRFFVLGTVSWIYIQIHTFSQYDTYYSRNVVKKFNWWLYMDFVFACQATTGFRFPFLAFLSVPLDQLLMKLTCHFSIYLKKTYSLVNCRSRDLFITSSCNMLK